MKTEYVPEQLWEKIGYLVEECGEVQQAIGKSMRWGLESCNPELTAVDRETNREWILRELKDLISAAKMVDEALRAPDPE